MRGGRQTERKGEGEGRGERERERERERDVKLSMYTRWVKVSGRVLTNERKLKDDLMCVYINSQWIDTHFV